MYGLLYSKSYQIKNENPHHDLAFESLIPLKNAGWLASICVHFKNKKERLGWIYSFIYISEEKPRKWQRKEIYLGQGSRVRHLKSRISESGWSYLITAFTCVRNRTLLKRMTMFLRLYSSRTGSGRLVDDGEKRREDGKNREVHRYWTRSI